MERIYKDLPAKMPGGGGLKDRPRCERCGRPIKVSSDDYEREELLCAHCAADAKVSSDSEYDFQ